MSSRLDDSQRIVIVGASLAGVRAAEGARDAGFAGEIVLVGEEKHEPYDRPPLSKKSLEAGAESTPFLRLPDELDALRLTFLLGKPASGLDTVRKSVRVGAKSVTYDRLVLATGSSPRILPGLEPEYPGIVTLRRMEDSIVVAEAIASGGPLVIVGGGFIGAEIASAAQARGCRVTLVEASLSPLERALGQEMGGRLSEMHTRNGVDLRCGIVVTGVQRDSTGRLVSVLLSDGAVIEARTLIVGIGAAPATRWLEGSGIDIAPDGAVVCDSTLRTSASDVYAAGDIVSWPNDVMGTHMRLENWTSANEQGGVAGHNAVVGGEGAVEFSTVPYFWSDWYGNRVQFVGRASAEPPAVVLGAIDLDKFVALYREGDRVVGSLAVNEPTKIMKDRRRIAEGATWAEVMRHYQSLNSGSAARAPAVSATA